MPRSLVVAVLLFPPLHAQTTVPRLDRAVRLGADAMEFGRIDYGAVGTNGVVVAVDGENFRLYRFAPDGSLRDSLGARGEGPGEFRAAAGLRIGPTGEVALVDILTRRLTLWPATGRASTQVSITTGTPLAMPAWDNGPIVTLTDFVASIDQMVIMPGKAPVSAMKIPFANMPTTQCDQCPAVPIGDGRWVMAATRDSTYRLVEFGPGGRAVRSWSRPAAPPRRRTDGELDALTSQIMRGPGGGASSPEGRPPAPDRERFRYPPRITALERDGAGRIWALAHHAGTTHGAFDIFSPAGSFLGTIRFAEPIRSFSISGDRLVAWGEDANDEPALWSYRILQR
jgi:hypothetical protein